MNQQKTLSTPTKTLVRMQVVHLGKILFNLQFIGVAVMMASVLSFIMPAIYYLMLICAAVLSLFILLGYPTFRSLWAGGETLLQVADTLTRSWQYTVPIVAGLAVAAIVCLCFDKHQRHPARITVSVIIAALALFVLFLKIANTGVFA